ncbi:MAG: prolyl oligopeptidase family serine peptidase [Gemmatimonadales bacterium]|nr:prolyl oligopeptidase family serine peptidase [Gemmatimonadales bacterium]
MNRFVALLLVMPFVLSAQGRPFDDAAWQAVERLESAIPSPDGRSIAFTRTAVDSATGRYRHAVWVMNDEGGNLREVARGRLPGWSPDSRRLAVVQDGRIEVVTIDGTLVPFTLAIPHLRIKQLRWSPDGGRLAVTVQAIDRDLVPEGALGVRLTTGAFPGAGRAVWMMSLDGAPPRALTPPGFDVGIPDPGLPDVGEVDWIDGATLVVAGHPGGEGWLGETVIAVIDTLGSPLRILPLGVGVWHGPVVSPDGKSIALSGHNWSEAGWTAEEVWVIQPDGTGIRRLTANLDRDVANLSWAADNQTIWFTVEERGSRNIHQVKLGRGAPSPAITGVHLLSLGGIARVGNYGVTLREQPGVPAAVWRFPLDKPWQMQLLFAPSEAVMAAVAVGETEEFEYRTSDGTPIHAWLLRPPGYDPARRYPLLVEVHGGPHAMASAGFSPSRLRHASDGWLVLAVNPRGSTGFGSDFANMIARAWPGIDVDDILDGVNDVIARGLADSTRLALVGVGGGGVAVGSIIGRTDRFSAAILRCTGSGWMTLGGGPDRAPWGEWGNAKPIGIAAEVWLERSPIRQVLAVRTPTLTIAGMRTEPIAAEFAEAFHLGVGRTGTAAAFIRFDDGCGAAATLPATGAAIHRAESAWLRRHAAGAP